MERQMSKSLSYVRKYNHKHIMGKKQTIFSFQCQCAWSSKSPQITDLQRLLLPNRNKNCLWGTQTEFRTNVGIIFKPVLVNDRGAERDNEISPRLKKQPERGLFWYEFETDMTGDNCPEESALGMLHCCPVTIGVWLLKTPELRDAGSTHFNGGL